MRLPRITICLCTRNGAAHLQAQLDSFTAQTHRNWALWISDDGSTDATRDILHSFRRAHGARHDIRIIDGPQQGVAANYMSLLSHPDLPPGPVALSDQDDVWHPDKLARAIAAIAPHGGPVLYGARYLFCDAVLNVTGHAPVARRGPSFANALVQNIVSGHTAVLNAGALALVRRAGVPSDIPFHDWWLYLLVTGAGGTVICDRAKVLRYRQHGANTLGAHHGARAAAARMAMVMGHRYGDWVRANWGALRHVPGLLTLENRDLLRALCAPGAPRAGLARVTLLSRSGLHRQTRAGTAALWLAALLGRV